LAHPAEFFGAYPIIAGKLLLVKRKRQKKKRVIPAFLLPKLGNEVPSDQPDNNNRPKNGSGPKKKNRRESKESSESTHFSFLFK